MQYNQAWLRSILKPILDRYYKSFSTKVYGQENNDTDFLMQLYGITPAQKRENRQYWGRELGMLWQLIVTELSKTLRPDIFSPAERIGKDEPYDLRLGNDAIDTKYRIGSGDSGTLKKFKLYGELLISHGHQPVFLIVREDNLPAAIHACRVGGWNVFQGYETIEYLEDKLGIRVDELVKGFADAYLLDSHLR
nr:hypothetical protein [Schaalia odontolytica]